MNILVNVVNQRMKVATNIKSLVAGTQNFVRFQFALGDEWKDLMPFAQFRQGGDASRNQARNMYGHAVW